ncbi:hypothetical protein I6J32_10865 [Moraxella osloensis]|nr:hypothetical protein [Moraxella osloensis]QRO13077.1 hypothetical protein I6J32_10865 [Moraxella osloensis]
MNRTIISKVALKYDDVTVATQSLIAELAPSANVLTDAQAIVGFFEEVVHLTSNGDTQFYNNVQSSQLHSYPNADDNHEGVPSHYGYKRSIGNIVAIDNTLSIRMLNIVNGIEQDMGLGIEDYTPKKIALEIYSLSPEQIQTELQYIQTLIPFDVQTSIESLYDLIKPFVPLDMPNLEQKGYAKAVSDDTKIVLYANAMQYTKMWQ